MPTYDMECPKCKWAGEVVCFIDERNRQPCPSCGSMAKIVFSVPFVQTWKPSWFGLNGPSDSVYITSKKQLFEECRKRGKFAEGYGQECKLVEANAPRCPVRPS